MAQTAPPFPEVISFTVTNACNLKCRMCGQWGLTGYFGERKAPQSMPASRWLELADEAVKGGTKVAALRGGETLLFTGIFDLVRRLKAGGIFTCMDSNGTLFERYAKELLDCGLDIAVVSVDGPEAVHDHIRGVKGTFQALKRGIRAVREEERARGREGRLVPTICFTISADNWSHLPEMPGVARELDVPKVCANPYYHIPRAMGEEYARRMREELDCDAYSWKGFHREGSGVDPEGFVRARRDYLARLEGVKDEPTIEDDRFMPFTEQEYRDWFSGSADCVGRRECTNPFKLLDIQPGGDANFCVDYPDYIIGNLARNGIREVWNGERARKFREAANRNPFPVCNRCGAKYMSS
jgi:MoaA/NifB/PqqE/SkfB family radical SAM enzyme